LPLKWLANANIANIIISSNYIPKNGVLTVHYGVEEIIVNVREMLKKFYWTYLLIWTFLKVALNRSIILKYTRMYSLSSERLVDIKVTKFYVEKRVASAGKI
jgi:hypothetical protein